ncbi:Uncharacterized protein ToN1_03100 [Aromatoleum petrolei]|nr:Uncharacterized protein ToN1_03100 [Aromatoleum petrolei]
MMGGGGDPGTMMKGRQQMEHRMDMMEHKLGTTGKRPAQSK